MIANAAVMMMLMQQNKQNGWEPGDWDGDGVLFLILALMIMTAFTIVWVFA
jgi:hypothetical protein